jgi:hypothetical protein
VNAGFGQVSAYRHFNDLCMRHKVLWMTKILLQDKLMTAPSDSSGGSSGNWLFKNKEHGKASAAASLVLEQLVFYFCK